MGYPTKGRADFLIVGDWNVVCSMCGNKRKALNDGMVKNWQGMWRCPEHNESRQPQDFVRSVPDVQTPVWNQPPSETFVYVCDLNSISAIPGYALPGCMLPGRAYVDLTAPFA